MSYFFLRLVAGLKLLPQRLRRVGTHLLAFCPWRGSWWADLFFLLADLLLIFDAYELLSNSLALRTRPLRRREVEILRTIYGSSLPYELIRIDEYARLGPPQGRFCYVSFFTINAWGPMSDPTLVHEAMHVWQYVRDGAAYIPRALSAQKTEMGYNYGGPKRLRNFPSLAYFNYEQRADIITDAYCILEGNQPRWSPVGTPIDPFLPFLAEVRRGGKA